MLTASALRTGRRAGGAGFARALHANRPAASTAAELPPSAQPCTASLDLTNPQVAFQASTSLEIVRGVAVLTACSQPWLVRRAESILTLSRKLLGSTVTDKMLRHTVFAHFVAGVSTLRSLRNALLRAPHPMPD